MIWRVEEVDVLEWAARHDGPKFHALLCDPPYELGFMGKDWDRSGIAFKPDTWAALAEHLHPGAFGMAFASARGWHRLAVAIEDAGLRIHPSIFGWSYGSGFPKATRIDTQVDKAAGHKPATKKKGGKGPFNDTGRCKICGRQYFSGLSCQCPTPVATTLLACAWQGHRYGLQALKPALEPIIVFQKPYEGKPVNCITEMGAGALNIEGGRINFQSSEEVQSHAEQWNRTWNPNTRSSPIHAWDDDIGNHPGKKREKGNAKPASGRWPANFILQHTPQCVRADPDGLETIAAWDCVPECPVRRLGEQSGKRPVSGTARLGKENLSRPGSATVYGRYNPHRATMPNDKGTAARFFFQADWNLETADPVLYCAKASRKERDAGLEKFEFRSGAELVNRKPGSAGLQNPRAGAGRTSGGRNPHPTIKPIALARWLATLLLPPLEYAPRRILIPFSGSGSEGIGAGLAGWDEITMIDNEAEYCEIAEARMVYWLSRPEQMSFMESR